MSTAYSNDFEVWIDQTAQMLREQRWHDVDIEHLIEEIENLGKSERRSIASQLTRLLLHLLKWCYQPERRSDSCLDSITDARTQLELILQDSPSLRNYPQEKLAENYQRACRQAAKQTGLPSSTFPDACPFLIELVLDEIWLPDHPEF